MEPAEAGLAPLVVAYRGARAKASAIELASALRGKGGRAVVAPERSLKGQLRYSSAIGAPGVFILGDAEIERGTVTYRDMATSEQREVARADAPDVFPEL